MKRGMQDAGRDLHNEKNAETVQNLGKSAASTASSQPRKRARKAINGDQSAETRKSSSIAEFSARKVIYDEMGYSSPEDEDDDERERMNSADGQVSSRGNNARPISVSCETCKLRKVKCDRGVPSCGWCTRNGQTCEYKERRKPGLRAGYGRELESRLDRMEALLASHSRILEHHGQLVAPHMGQPQRSPPEHFQHQQHHDKSMRPRSLSKAESDGAIAGSLLRLAQVGRITEEHFIDPNLSDALIDESGSNSMMANQNDRANDVGQDSGGNSYPEPIRDIQAIQMSQPTAIDFQDPLPPEDLLFALVDLYFQHINTWFPLLHRLSTIQQLFPPTTQYGYDSTQYEFQQRPKRSIPDQMLLHALVATSLRFSTDVRFTNNEALRKHYHDSSKQKVLLYGMESSTLQALKAMVILAIDVVGDSNGPPGWSILAVITRMVIHLGLAIEASSTADLILRQARGNNNQGKANKDMRNRAAAATRSSSGDGDPSLNQGPDRPSTSSSRNSTPAPMLPPQAYPSFLAKRPSFVPEPTSWLEDESHRRLFWAVYSLDRYATVGTSFDFVLSDAEINRLLPCAEAYWDSSTPVLTRWFKPPAALKSDFPVINYPDHMGTFSYYIEILGLLSNVHRFLREVIDITSLSEVEKWQGQYRVLDSRLINWKHGLPPRFGNMARIFSARNTQTAAHGNDVDAGWVMIHAMYQMACIRIHSSAGFPSATSPIFQRSYSATQRCLSAVESISALNQFVVHNHLLTKLGPPYAFTLWVAARVLLMCGSTREHNVEADLLSFIETLRDMGKLWSVAGRYSSILKRVVEEQKMVEEEESSSGEVSKVNTGSDRDGSGRLLEKNSLEDLGTSSGGEREPKTAKSLSVLRDLRHHAFDLDLLISRQPQVLRRKPKRPNRPSSVNTGAPGSPAQAGLQIQTATNLDASNSGDIFSPNNPPTVNTNSTDNEYNDVFDWFNLPRLPNTFAGTLDAQSTEGEALNEQLAIASAAGGFGNTWGGMDDGGVNNSFNTAGVQSNEFNVTNFLVDVNSDWLFSTGQ